MKQRIAQKLATISSAPISTKPGPKTEAAKNKVKVNSYVHGLTAQHLLIHPDDQPYYDKMSEDFRLRFQPADGFELELLQKIVDATWRLNICASVESAMFANVTNHRWDDAGDTTPATRLSRRARTFTEQASSFSILGRYEAGLRRGFHAMLQELEEAIANRPQPIEESIMEPTQEPVPAKPLVMTAAAGSQPQPNNHLTPENDSFRKTAVSPAVTHQTPRSPHLSDFAQTGTAQPHTPKFS